MLIFFIISFIAISAIHRFVMDSVDEYSNYGATPHQEWLNFEREKLNF